MTEVAYPQTLKAVKECLETCGICSSKAIDEKLDCSKHCQGCATLCMTMMNWITLNAKELDIKNLGQVLLKTCDDCGNMCMGHEQEHCKTCAKSCKGVVDAIKQEMLTAK